MTDTTESAGIPEATRHLTARETERRSLLLDLVAWRLARLQHGSLRLGLPNGAERVLSGSGPGAAADLRINSHRAVLRAMLRGPLGFAEGYLRQEWETGNLAELLRFFIDNFETVSAGSAGLFRVRGRDRRFHASRSNTLAGSRRNIAEHYDLGNAFYALWLDRGLNYSSGIYSDAGETLEEAQTAKTARVLAWLEVKPDDRLLEIGCGWGSLAAAALAEGASVTALTLSKEQLASAHHRVAATGRGDRADLRLQDYRECEGSFDCIASIEMVEAVGEENWPRYFRMLHERLKPGGIAVLQAITIAEQHFAAYRRTPDFIQRYIFPGGMLPTASIIAEEARRAGLILERTFLFGDSYARTLWCWLDRFRAAWADIERLGFDARFRHMWEYYLVYCAVGFERQVTDVGLYRLRRAA